MKTLGFGRESRVFLVDNGLGILANTEDENLLDIQDQMGGVLVAPGIPSGLVQTPSALNRWMEEAIILDADSIHDCVAALKPEILDIVEEQRDEELAERRERRKKQQEEDAIRRKKEEEEREKNKDASAPSSTAIPASTSTSVVPPPVTMEVAQPEAPNNFAEPTSFGSFFHGFNMQSTGTASSMTSTPLVRSHDHAETLATSIVEAVLGPALESVSGHSRSNAEINREQIETTPTPLLHARVQAQSLAVTPTESTSEPIVPVIVETPAGNNSRSATQSLQSTVQRILTESTPADVGQADEQTTTTPFNPIPNATPGAPRHVSAMEEVHPFSTDQAQYIRRPLTFQGEITPMRPAEESLTVEGN